MTAFGQFPHLQRLEETLEALDSFPRVHPPCDEEKTRVTTAAQLFNELTDDERDAWRRHGRLHGP